MSYENLQGLMTVRDGKIQIKTTTPERKPVECDKNSEIEKIKRQLAQLIDRVDALKKA